MMMVYILMMMMVYILMMMMMVYILMMKMLYILMKMMVYILMMMMVYILMKMLLCFSRFAAASLIKLLLSFLFLSRALTLKESARLNESRFFFILFLWNAFNLEEVFGSSSWLFLSAAEGWSARRPR